MTGIRKILLLAATMVLAMGLFAFVKHTYDAKEKEKLSVMAELNKQNEAEFEQRALAKEEELAAQAAEEEAAALKDSSVYKKLEKAIPINVLIIGDSIANDIAEPLKTKLTEEYGSEVNLSNIALKGNSSNYTAYVQTVLLNDGTDYDLAVICSGYMDTTASYSPYLELTIRELIRKQPDCSVIVASENAPEDSAWKHEELKKLCKHYSIPVADVYTEFLPYYSTLVSDNGIRPNNEGLELYTKVIAQLIAENVAAGTDKKDYSAAVMNQKTADCDELRYIAKNDFNRENDLTYSLETEFSGVLGVDHVYTSSEPMTRILLDGSVCFFPTLDHNIYQPTRQILMIQDYAAANLDVRIEFPDKESADLFGGLVIGK